ncbi:hypothetical protein X733_31285 [Mesorhizobium sp. L2C067A000]|nr:hypothetical protein X733_31285 [Mesorhizobium sp. L2C067A000]
MLLKKTALNSGRGWRNTGQRLVSPARNEGLAARNLLFSLPTYGNVLAVGLGHPNAIDLSELDTVEPVAVHGYGAGSGIGH